MKTTLLTAALSLLMVSRVTAQTFTTIKSFGNLTNVSGFNPQSTLVQAPDGTLYGTARNGDGSLPGTVFKMQPDGSGFTVLKWFTNSIEGANPVAGMALSGSVLYGTTSKGGSSNLGTVFRINTDGTSYAVLKSFTGSDGANPYYAGLALSGTVLYGMTYYGGASNLGTIFKLNTDGTGQAVLKSFTGGTGANPNVGLTISGSVLYGTTENGGNSGSGTVFKMNADGTGYTVLHNFTDSLDGAYPDGALALSGSVLYGTTYRGGSSGAGTLFKLNTNGTGYAVLKNFTGSDSSNPTGPLALAGGALYGTTSSGGSWGTVFRINTNGTGFTLLHSFTNSPDGALPFAGLTLAGSVLYGTTSDGGNSGRGTVFRVNTNGTGYTMFQLFNPSTDGAAPYAGLTLSDSVLYGTTYFGGASNFGTVFKVNTDGTGYAVLRNFAGGDGLGSWARLTLSNTVLYGTTLGGGSSGDGTVFALNTDGTGFTTLHSFSARPSGTNSDGASPFAGLLLSGSKLYGTAAGGGTAGSGAVFALNTDGTGFRNLYSFTAPTHANPDLGDTNTDGTTPQTGLILSGNTLYGTAAFGGSAGRGTVFALNTNGTGFTTLHAFTAWSTISRGIYTNGDGSHPNALILSGNVVYGTALQGGTSGYGTVFALNTDGTGFRTLHHFTGGSDGGIPKSELVLSGNTLYGTTWQGGRGPGTVFKINTDGTGFMNLYSFTGRRDGVGPAAGVVLSGNTLYGTTSGGGLLGNGTVFSLSFRPQLTITPSGIPPGGIILSWPTNVAGFDYTGYTLQDATNLVPPAAWAAHSPAPVVVNGQNTVTNTISGSQKFYRLIQ